ncbi:hypothetical protein [Flavobacterium sp.]|uniref:hypothetical protein n=1 Tax=Flavobacterium sp. TaxID=239 RepID=UPI003D0B3EE3
MDLSSRGICVSNFGHVALGFSGFDFQAHYCSAVMFYYWQESGRKFSWFYLFLLFLYFISGMLNLFEDVEVLQYVMLVNMGIYFLLLLLVLLNIRRLKVQFLDRFNLFYVLLSAVFVGTLAYLSVFWVFNESFKLYSYIISYAIVLGVLGIGVSILYVYQPEKANVYLMYTVFCYLICDIFYIIYYYAYDFIFFRLLSILGSVVSYYCLVNFFLRTNENIGIQGYL